MKTKQDDTVKIYKRRDSATAALRKLGIKARDYNAFIEVMKDGKIMCRLAAAKAHLTNAAVSKAVTDKTPPIKTTKRLKKERGQDAEDALKVPKEKKVTISSLCRDMILDGKSNEEILAALRKKFGEERFGPEKNSYPCWYRCELRRKGLLPPAFETSTQLDKNAIHKFED